MIDLGETTPSENTSASGTMIAVLHNSVIQTTSSTLPDLVPMRTKIYCNAKPTDATAARTIPRIDIESILITSHRVYIWAVGVGLVGSL
mgnify:CR=1 FL=1